MRLPQVEAANRRQVERAREAGWELEIVTDEDLRPDKWDETRERVGAFLARQRREEGGA